MTSQPLSATDPGPVPPEASDPHTERLHVIASLHSVADYLAAHPDMPTPTSITLNAYNHEANTGPLDRVAEHHHGRRYALESSGTMGWLHEYAEVQLAAHIKYVLSTTVRSS